jgi:hypothetical protein
MTGLIAALQPVLVLVLGTLVELWAPHLKPTFDDADPDGDRRERLIRQVRRHWPVVLVLFATVGLSGCVRTTYVPDGTPVRLRETLPDVKVWVKGDDGEPVAGRMDLHEGWYALPLGDEE